MQPWPSSIQLADPTELVDRRLGDLDARETRLLAIGVGEHIPHEVLVNLDALHAERARLLGQNAPLAF
jgi:hypothetical protein